MMAELLRQIGVVLLLSIVGLVLLVILHEVVRSIEYYRWQKRKTRCRALLGQLEFLNMEEIVKLAKELESSFPTEMIESLLDELLCEMTHQNRSILYDELGLVKHYLHIFHSASSWSERANAAEKLGHMGHHRAVPSLIATLHDDNEDNEVKRVALLALGEIHDERAIEPLVESLKHLSDLAIGQVITDVLMQFNELAVPTLVQALSSSKNPTQRYWAAKILRRTTHPSAITELLNALGDHSTKVRAEAALSLGMLRVDEAVIPLTKMILQDPSSLAREAAAESLGNIADDYALAALRDGLADLDNMTRRQAMISLEHMGDKSIPFFLAAFRGESAEAQAQAAMALERMGVVAGWIEELGQEEQWEFAFDQLCRVARAGTVETLIRSLAHPQLSVRIRLCRILSQESSERAVETLADLALKDLEWAVRLEALLALLKLNSPRLMPLLERALTEEEESIRERLLRALREAPRALMETLAKAVSPLLEDANLKIRIEAIKTLAMIHTEEVFSSVLASMQDAEPFVREEAAKALQYYPQQEAVNALIRAMQDADRAVRITAIKSLGRLKNPRAIRPLTQAFEQADQEYRDDIASALAAMPIQEFYAYTDFLMGLSHPTARAGVAWTLGLIGDQRGLQLLSAFLQDPEAKVRASAAGAIGRFERKDMLPILFNCLADPDEKVRAAVINALSSSDEISVMGRLLLLLPHEPDVFVQQKIALAVARLKNSNANNKSLLPIVTTAIKQIRKWLEKVNDIHSRVSGLISLAILEDEFSFQDILDSIQQSETRKLLQEKLKMLPLVMQKQFFSFLSLDPQLFWQNQDKKTGEHYVWLLRSSRDERDRVRAIRTLSTLKEESSAIESAVNDPSPRVRAAAINALGEIMSSNQLIPKIIEAARDPSDLVRARVISLLHRLSAKELQESREQFIPLLESTQTEIREQIAALLARLYRNDWATLVDQLLGAEKSSGLLGLINTLSRIADPKVIAFFVQFLSHEDSRVRSVAAFAAAQSGMLSKQQWIPYLDDPLESVRLAAIRGLGQQLDAEVVELFAKHLEDPLIKIRCEVAFFLGKKKIQGNDRQQEILRSLIKNETNLEVILISLIALFHLGITGLGKEISSTMSKMTEEERIAILKYLKREGIFAKLLENTQHAHAAHVRKEAIELLAALNISGYLSEIVAALQDLSSAVRLSAIEALQQIDNPAIQRAIEALTQDPVEQVRQAAQGRSKHQ